MDERKHANEWFGIADEDLASAKYLRDREPAPYGIICFLCQQSAEKFLKGFLALKGEEIPKIHDLIQHCPDTFLLTTESYPSHARRTSPLDPLS